MERRFWWWRDLGLKEPSIQWKTLLYSVYRFSLYRYIVYLVGGLERERKRERQITDRKREVSALKRFAKNRIKPPSVKHPNQLMGAEMLCYRSVQFGSIRFNSRVQVCWYWSNSNPYIYLNRSYLNIGRYWPIPEGTGQYQTTF